MNYNEEIQKRWEKFESETMWGWPAKVKKGDMRMAFIAGMAVAASMLRGKMLGETKKVRKAIYSEVDEYLQNGSSIVYNLKSGGTTDGTQ